MTDQAEKPNFRDKWALEVGRFVMAFGSIEGMTIALIRSEYEEVEAEKHVTAALGKRLDLLIKRYEKKAGGWEVVAKVLREVKAMATRRNLIAHNGVSLDVYLSPEKQLRIKHAIRSHRARKDTRKPTESKYLMEFDELVRLRNEAEDLDERLVTLVRVNEEAE